MSLKATDWALKQKTRNPALKLVLVLLSDCESGDWRCIFNIETIAEQAEVDVEALQRALDKLEAVDLIIKSEDQTHPMTGKPLVYPFMSYDLGE